MTTFQGGTVSSGRRCEENRKFHTEKAKEKSEKGFSLFARERTNRRLGWMFPFAPPPQTQRACMKFTHEEFWCRAWENVFLQLQRYVDIKNNTSPGFNVYSIWVFNLSNLESSSEPLACKTVSRIRRSLSGLLEIINANFGSVVRRQNHIFRPAEETFSTQGSNRREDFNSPRNRYT